MNHSAHKGQPGGAAGESAMAGQHAPERASDSLVGQRVSVFDLNAVSLRELLASWGEPAYRATQLLEWVYRGATRFAEMTNLAKPLREKLTANVDLRRSQIVRRQEARDGTIKLLLRWPDGQTSETVLIPEGERRTTCVSTQVGCPVGCVFCASGLGGLKRQLSAGEIVEQAMRASEACAPVRLSNLVFMGLGEPLANYQATVQAVRTINAEWGLAIGARKITVSTVGLPSQMRRLADEALQITLALSLHAPTDELRRQIIPWAKRVEIAELIDAGRYYFEKTGREVTLEYVLLGGLNDSAEQAVALGRVARQLRSNVNLIPYNPVEMLPFCRPREQDVGHFLNHLREAGVNAHIRASRGLDIDAACGQLRYRQGLEARPDQTNVFPDPNQTVPGRPPVP